MRLAFTSYSLAAHHYPVPFALCHEAEGLLEQAGVPYQVRRRYEGMIYEVPEASGRFKQWYESRVWHHCHCEVTRQEAAMLRRLLKTHRQEVQMGWWQWVSPGRRIYRGVMTAGLLRRIEAALPAAGILLY